MALLIIQSILVVAHTRRKGRYTSSRACCRARRLGLPPSHTFGASPTNCPSCQLPQVQGRDSIINQYTICSSSSNQTGMAWQSPKLQFTSLPACLIECIHAYALPCCVMSCHTSIIPYTDRVAVTGRQAGLEEDDKEEANVRRCSSINH